MSPRISIRLLAAQSDQRLIALACQGHERAFEALVHRYRRPLLRHARAMGLGEARAEDVVQQALLRSWVALSRDGVIVHDARSWLYRIVHNLAVNALRGGPEAQSELTQAVQDKAGLTRTSNLERRIAIRDALGEVAALPQMQRQAIFLTAVDGQSHEEVAGTMGITPGALRGLLYRARATLRSAAAALTPQPLLELAARSGETGSGAAERALELTGAGGVLLKAGVTIVTAGALATGAGVVVPHKHHGRQGHVSPTISASASPSQTSPRIALDGQGGISTSAPRVVRGEDRARGQHHVGISSSREGRGGDRQQTPRTGRHNDAEFETKLAMVPAGGDRGQPSADRPDPAEGRTASEGHHPRHSGLFDVRHADRRGFAPVDQRHGGDFRQGASSHDGSAQPSTERGSASPTGSSGSGSDDTSAIQVSDTPTSQSSGWSETLGTP